MRRFLVAFMFILLAPLALRADDLDNLRSRFMKIMLTGSSSGLKVDCKDADFAKLLSAQGIAVDGDAAAAWATTAAEVTAAAAKKKIVIVPKVELLAKGACLALVEEGGKMVFYLHFQNLQKTGKSVSDTVMRAAKKFE